MTTKGLRFFFSFLWVLIACCSGTFVGYSYDTRDPTEADVASLLKRIKATSTEVRGFVEDHNTLLDPYVKSNISVHLQFCSSRVQQLLGFRASSVAWLKSILLNTPPQITISSIVLSGQQSLLPVLLPTLKSFHTAIRSFKIDQTPKVAAMLSLPQLGILKKTHDNSLGKLISFLKKTDSFLVVELPLDEELDSGDLVPLVVKKILSAAFTLLSDIDVPVVLNFQVPIASTGVKIAELAKEVVRSHSDKKAFTIRGIFLGVSAIEEIKQSKHFSGKVEAHSLTHSHRELLSHKDRPIMAARHDFVSPVTNPVTNPTTTPTMYNPPGIVTVPSTNPVTVLPTNPSIPAVTVPSTNPVTTPFTIPPTNPVTPTTVPTTLPPPSNVIPITNPVTTPVTVPFNPPATNPVVYPFPPPNALPGGIEPGMVQNWCVARTGSSDAALQLAIDYACGIGGADCSAIQQMGSCFVPNTLRDHASYAFNSYYQKNPSPASCDFGGTAMLVNVNPSTGTCMYPSSSSSSSTLNANPSPGGTTTVFGSANPIGSTNPIVSNSPLSSSNPASTTTTSSSSVSTGLWFLFPSAAVLLFL